MSVTVYRIFKGTNSEYRMLHYWVEKQLGKPKECKSCGLTDEDRRYHWANISSEYKRDTSDWERLCVPCHKRKDMAANPVQSFCEIGVCVRGHTFTKENAYTRPNGTIECVECRKIRHKLTRKPKPNTLIKKEQPYDRTSE